MRSPTAGGASRPHPITLPLPLSTISSLELLINYKTSVFRSSSHDLPTVERAGGVWLPYLSYDGLMEMGMAGDAGDGRAEKLQLKLKREYGDGRWDGAPTFPFDPGKRRKTTSSARAMLAPDTCYFQVQVRIA